ncbi:MAG: hypothetical protein IAF38_07025 [Bacteroidia bacterium]|nr:hypothetical protein [Bacteroidia bacterium]
MEEKEISVEESLNIMQSMVRRAQNNVSDNGFMFIFWGWLVFITGGIFYALMKSGWEYAPVIWGVTMPLGGVFSAIYGYSQKKKEKVKTYIDDYLGYLWGAFGISLFITIFMGSKLQGNGYPVIIMLYGIATFISGGLLKFRPLIIGGFLSFPISAACFFVPMQEQVIPLCVSLLVSYIIPGHLLQAKFKKHGV